MPQEYEDPSYDFSNPMMGGGIFMPEPVRPPVSRLFDIALTPSSTTNSILPPCHMSPTRLLGKTPYIRSLSLMISAACLRPALKRSSGSHMSRLILRLRLN